MTLESYQFPATASAAQAFETSFVRVSEARDIVRIALSQESAHPGSFADAIRVRIEPLGGMELRLPGRAMMREPRRVE